MVETPLGPNQAMKPRVAMSVAVPRRAASTPTGRASSSAMITIATAAHPSANRPWIVSSDPNTTNTEILTISTMSSDCAK